MAAHLISLIGIVFVIATFCAMASDAWRMEIPNYISIVLAISFIIFASLTPAVPPVAHFATATIVFAVAVGFFTIGWFGGGDVKFLGATALWAGPDHILPVLLAMSVVGVVLSMTIALLIKTRWAGIANTGSHGPDARGPRLWIEAGACPYGIAIGLGGLLFIAPNIFAV